MNTFYIVPCKNEENNIHAVATDFLNLSSEKDFLVFVEGGSLDQSALVAKQYSRQYKNRIYFLQQTKKGKFNAVRIAIQKLLADDSAGFIAIWDADHSIKFQDVKLAADISKSLDGFVYTERIGGSMEKHSMPFLNWIGNKVIAYFSTKVFKMNIKDALSGTKVLPLKIFRDLNRDILDFMERDTYGDLSYFLLARLNNLPTEKKIVNYFARTYGESSLPRFRNGLELFINLIECTKIIKKVN
jgi:glycosyltransferase involved in cell wall biosynthesis